MLSITHNSHQCRAIYIAVQKDLSLTFHFNMYSKQCYYLEWKQTAEWKRTSIHAWVGTLCQISWQSVEWVALWGKKPRNRHLSKFNTSVPTSNYDITDNGYILCIQWSAKSFSHKLNCLSTIHCSLIKIRNSQLNYKKSYFSRLETSVKLT